ncbi:McrC family protein [[Clostridium] aminophilum]|uniref:McrC family protein n=1 Tax=[Clostridium] aminophilum TaxID=1526 RepID=UPI003F9D7D7A
MVLNRYEESSIPNPRLPSAWKTQNALVELEEFLQHNWEQRAVFYEDGVVESKQQFLGFVGQQGIRTKNYIGTIVFNGEQLNIYPKMFKLDKYDTETEDLSQKHLMKNLVRWLEYCNRIAYPFISISTDLNDAEDLKELFITLYIGYVRSALDRGLYYRYVEETDDINSIKGKFDLKDYFTRKVPNGQADKFRCTYSTFEFDNTVNRVIKYTCKQIYNMTSKKNQKAIRNILVKLNDVSDVPCQPGDCDRIRLSKMHAQYRIIMSMSKMFLLNKTSGYTMDTNESFCFMFPTELLFEGFIGGYMQEVVGEYGGIVKLQQSEMHLIEDIQYDGRSLGAAFTMRHDILVEVNEKVFILDTKYKQVSRFEGDTDEIKRVVSEEPKQTDIYQVCEYARKRNITDVYLLYPMFRYEENEPSHPIGKSQGASGDINIHFVRLPFIFEDDEEKVKMQLKKVIEDILQLE